VMVIFSDLNLLGPAVGLELGIVEGATDVDGIGLTDGCIEGAGLNTRYPGRHIRWL
jgi:hypothetical protein